MIGKPWVGASPPHGAMPFANVMSIAAINSTVRPFCGAPATVVFRTPFLRYLLLFGPCCAVSKESIVKHLNMGQCVGLVPDGIAGIFRCSKKVRWVGGRGCFVSVVFGGF